MSSSNKDVKVTSLGRIHRKPMFFSQQSQASKHSACKHKLIKQVGASKLLETEGAPRLSQAAREASKARRQLPIIFLIPRNPYSHSAG